MANFATLDQVRPFLNVGLYNKLNSIVTGTTKYFEGVASQVDIYIRDRTNNPIGTTLDWIPFPYALLITKFSSHLIENQTPEYMKQIEDNFNLANELLDDHPYVNPSTGEAEPSDSSKGFQGGIDGTVDLNPLNGSYYL
jgi:hypothetical protein